MFLMILTIKIADILISPNFPITDHMGLKNIEIVRKYYIKELKHYVVGLICPRLFE